MGDLKWLPFEDRFAFYGLLEEGTRRFAYRVHRRIAGVRRPVKSPAASDVMSSVFVELSRGWNSRLLKTRRRCRLGCTSNRDMSSRTGGGSLFLTQLELEFRLTSPKALVLDALEDV